MTPKSIISTCNKVVSFKRYYFRSMMFASQPENWFGSYLSLGSGFIFGLLLSAVIVLNIPPNEYTIEKARELGIVSKTILMGYPKHKEVLNYFIFIVITPLTAIITWFFWALIGSRYKTQQSHHINYEMKETEGMLPLKPFPTWFNYGVIPVLIGYLSFRIDGFYLWPGSWDFLSEEGQHLAWTNRILAGGVLYRDDYLLYGPFYNYLLAGWMSVFGISVTVGRILTFVMSILSVLFVYYFLNEVLRSRWLKLLGVFILYGMYFSEGYYSYWVSMSIMRVCIALPAIYFLRKFIEKSGKLYLVISGVVSGLTLMYSQEVGLSLTISLVFSILILGIMDSKSLSEGLSWFVYFIGGYSLPVLFFLVYFAFHHALIDFITNMFVYPKYVMMGFGGLPYPDLIKVLSDPMKNIWAIKGYLMILLFMFIITWLLVMVFRRRVHKRHIPLIALLVSSIILFRTALGRSDFGHVWMNSLLALLICLIIIDYIWWNLKGNNDRQIIHLTVQISALLFLGFLVLVFSFQSNTQITNLTSVKNYLPSHKFIYKKPENWVPLSIERAQDIMLPPEWASQISETVKYIKEHTKPDEYIYVYPNESMYYFLCNRENPTRFTMATEAVTRKDRLSIVNDLEANKPKYIIFSHNTWRVDGIPDDIQYPEVDQYLNNNYMIEKVITGTLILKRIKYL